MRAAIETIVAIASRGHGTVGTLPCAELRHAHLQAFTAAAAERYAPATVNRA